jgi:hypothetical protein
MKKSLFKNDFPREWDADAEKWLFLHADSPNIAVFWLKVGRHRRAFFRVGGFSAAS